MAERFSYEGWNLTFKEEFDSLSLYTGQTGRWKTTYPWGGHSQPINNEKQYYIDARDRGATDRPLGVDPFRIGNGVLTVEAKPTDPANRSLLWDSAYTSGLLTGETAFTQQYGYVEFSAKMPAVKGVLAALWLRPKGNSMAEIDVAEMVGQQPTQLLMNTQPDQPGQPSDLVLKTVPDMAAGFHTYGVEWNRDRITWYMDGQEMTGVTTWPELHQPMFPVISLAAGGNWPGNPVDAAMPAQLQVDYVRFYSRDPVAPPPDPTTLAESARPMKAFLGTAANERLTGTAGPDHLNGAAGADTLVGGTGDDTYVVDQAGDRVIENPGQGVDTLTTWMRHTRLPSAVENLKISSTGTANATGNGLANRITGGAGDNVIDGLGGNDLLSGGTGRDTFIIGPGKGGDVITDFEAGPGTSPGAGDRVRLDIAGLEDYDAVRRSLHQVGGDVELPLPGGQTLTFKNRSIDRFAADDFLFRTDLPQTRAPAAWQTGTPASNTLIAGNRDDYLDGSGGVDTMAGGLGDDTYAVDDTSDFIFETAGAGIDAVKSWAVDYQLPDFVEHLRLPGEYASRGRGNALNNRLEGGGGANLLDGGAGDDVLYGGRSADTLVGGSGRDTFLFRMANEQGDAILDFTPVEDRLDLRPLLSSVGYFGADPLADGWLWFKPTASGTTVVIDSDGSGPQTAWDMLRLDGVKPADLTLNGNVLA